MRHDGRNRFCAFGSKQKRDNFLNSLPAIRVFIVKTSVLEKLMHD